VPVEVSVDPLPASITESAVFHHRRLRQIYELALGHRRGEDLLGAALPLGRREDRHLLPLFRVLVVGGRRSRKPISILLKGAHRDRGLIRPLLFIVEGDCCIFICA